MDAHLLVFVYFHKCFFFFLQVLACSAFSGGVARKAFLNACAHKEKCFARMLAKATPLNVPVPKVVVTRIMQVIRFFFLSN